jgi:hypothetical protein
MEQLINTPDPEINAEETLEDLLDDLERSPVGIWMNLSYLNTPELKRLREFSKNLSAAVDEELRLQAGIFPQSGTAICPVCFAASNEADLNLLETPDDDESITYIWTCPSCHETADYRKWGLSQNRLAQREIRLWNAHVLPGDLVIYVPFPDADPERHCVNGPAYILEGHTAVVTLEGKSGCVAVRSCSPLNHAWLTKWLPL